MVAMGVIASTFIPVPLWFIWATIIGGGLVTGAITARIAQGIHVKDDSAKKFNSFSWRVWLVSSVVWGGVILFWLWRDVF